MGPKEPVIMTRKPRDPQEPILNGVLIWQIVLVSALAKVMQFI